MPWSPSSAAVVLCTSSSRPAGSLLRRTGSASPASSRLQVDAPPPPLPAGILDLMPSCSALATAAGLAVDGGPDTDARLFGVSIGLKRARDEEEDGDGGELPNSNGDGADVKPEEAAERRPEGGGSEERQSWPIYRPKPVYRACNGQDGAGAGSGSDQDRSHSR